MENVVASSQPVSFMAQWDKHDEEIAHLKKEADQKLLDLTKGVNDWINQQNLTWLVPNSDGRFTAMSPANIYHFTVINTDGKEMLLEIENKQTYVAQDDTPNARQALWENDMRVKKITGDQRSAGQLIGTVRFHYRMDGLESVDSLQDSLGSIEYYPPDARDFDYTSEHDGYTVADIVYDQDDNMVDTVRARHRDPAKRKDPFIEGEKILKLLLSSELLGRFDPYTKQRLPVAKETAW